VISQTQIDRIDTPFLANVSDEPPKYRLKFEAGFFIMPPDVLEKSPFTAISARSKERISALL